MNIVYCGAFRFPCFDAAAPRVLNNARLLKTLGHHVLVISWGGKYRQSDLCDDGKYRVSGIEYIVTDELDSNGGFLSKVARLFKRGKISLQYIKALNLEIDAIIIYNPDLYWSRTMLNYCIRNNIKLISDITEWYDNNELYFFQWFPNWLNMTWLQHKIKNKIVISNYLNSYYSESNNVVIPPLCDLNEKKWKSSVEDMRIKPFNGITLIYAGNPGKKDLVHTVINAVNSLASEGEKIRFLILGISKEAYYNKYNKKLLSNKLVDNIIFLGRVSQELVPAYYKYSDFMVLLREPTRKNMAGFPTKFAESITAGVPVIANSTSDLCKYIKSGKNGFLARGCDYNSIVETLKVMLHTLDKTKLSEIKNETRTMISSFDYMNYRNDVQLFLEKLC